MTNLSSMNTALTLLGGNARPGPGAIVAQQPKVAAESAPAKSTEPSVPADRQEADQIKARVDHVTAVMDELRSGKISPLSDRAQSVHVSRDFAGNHVDDRFIKEGTFAYSNVSAAHTAAGQAAFADRHVAMLNAYHYATEVADYGQRVAEGTNAEAQREAKMAAFDDAIGRGGATGEAAQAYKANYVRSSAAAGMELASAERGLDRATAMLKSQFGFQATVVGTDESGKSSFQGFELRHETYGLLIAVDAKGEVTLFDGDGVGHKASTYNDANPGAFIPELHNDEIRKADNETPWQGKLARMEQSFAQVESAFGLDALIP